MLYGEVDVESTIYIVGKSTSETLYYMEALAGICGMASGGTTSISDSPALAGAEGGIYVDGVTAVGVLYVPGTMFRSSKDGDEGNNGSVRPEAAVTGSKKHGVNWQEGSARAKKTGIPQGQWAQADLDYATKIANTLKSGESGYFDLPEGAQSIYSTYARWKYATCDKNVDKK